MSAHAPPAGRRRTRVRVLGTVQGVGFRPHVHRLAGELGLGGYVLNDARGVLLEVEGDSARVEAFLARLQSEAPPLAAIDEVGCEERPPCGERAFAIRPSPRGSVPDAPVAPDSATCPACLAELFAPGDRRFRYPFINCTDCGPRFTIVRGVPYDRPLTTMAGFAMCERCRSEYEDPGDRRFHAQPNACPRCGPALSLLGAGGVADPLAEAERALREGAIVAVKGIGGYHLACRADLEPAVRALRSRKHREEKPFALMAASLAAAEELVWLDGPSRSALGSRERPIVLARRREGAPVAGAVAPASRELGVMLPYSPLHHLLLADLGAALVMTSGNVSDEPIAFHDGDALRRLSAVADLVLGHDRPIETRTDDSVLRVRSGRRTMLRRSRGFVPASLALPGEGTPRPLLACGAELKHTFCVARGRRAWVSHHIGDLANFETLRSFTDGVAHFERLFAVVPEVVVHDRHPQYLSTRYALEREGVETIAVQHHHAHLAACLAEHGENGPAVGAIYDGAGFGEDGTVWGGEILLGDLADARRVGHLWPVAMPGGEQAIRQPWRMACSWLAAAGEEGVPPSLAGRVPARRWEQIRRLAEGGPASPPTTSMGRLFDAVSALCGLRAEVSFEGQAAIELEAACDPHEHAAYPAELLDGLVLDPRPTLRAALADLRGGTSAPVIATRFHRAVAELTARALVHAAREHGVELAVLSGGVFANAQLLEELSGRLARAGLRVLVPERLPAGDGGICLGQAAVAARRLARR